MARLPEMRLHAENGALVAREGLSISFYLRHSQRDIAQAVASSLKTYVRAVGSRTLTWYGTEDGDLHELDEPGWTFIWGQLRERTGLTVELFDNPSGVSQYAFRYQGLFLESEFLSHKPGAVSTVSFWLPPEYLDEHGPTGVRALALELAHPLPFNSGHAGFSLNTLLQLLGTSGRLRSWCLRHPGLDLSDTSGVSLELGNRVNGVHWLTFLGQPVLGELGGMAGLRERLRSPEITVRDMGRERALLTLGAAPEAGDLEQGQPLPLHRELTRILEPWLHQRRTPWGGFSPEDMHRWERRFLDP